MEISIYEDLKDIQRRYGTVLTKADLCSNASEKLTEIERALPGTETVLISAFNYDTAGLDKYLQKGKTIAFAGSSGTGKSTLINLLLGEDRFDTAGIDKNDRGRHTTTSRQLVRLPQGAMLIDTPGMRELGMWHQAEGIEKTFSDIRELMGQCRFSDCSHTNEPGCAIKSAIASGELSKERWEAYLKLESENAYSQDTDSYLAQKEKKFKEIAKINRRR
ncbi:MAG: ribosome small subunit-dependent GTPase A [Eubacteriales bacterium]|nr:ribosome small subunit-dependent GTPase A [Eubacteriales bacterium]MDY2934584.1 ribosome small subunit-dependent GTPase A [Anaerovoracaceae bacterium]